MVYGQRPVITYHLADAAEQRPTIPQKALNKYIEKYMTEMTKLIR